MNEIEIDQLIDGIGAVFPAAFHNMKPETVNDVYEVAVGDLDFADCKAQVAVLVRTGHGPFVTPGKDIRLPVLRRYGVLAPDVGDAWDTVTAFLAAGYYSDLSEDNLHPVIRRAFQSETFKGELKYRDGAYRPSAYARKVWGDVYAKAEKAHNDEVSFGPAGPVLAAVRTKGPVPLLAKPTQRPAIDAADALQAKRDADWEASLAP